MDRELPRDLGDRDVEEDPSLNTDFFGELV